MVRDVGSQASTVLHKGTMWALEQLLSSSWMKAAYDDNPSYVYVCVHARVGGVPEQEKWIGDPIFFPASSSVLLNASAYNSPHVSPPFYNQGQGKAGREGTVLAGALRVRDRVKRVPSPEPAPIEAPSRRKLIATTEPTGPTRSRRMTDIGSAPTSLPPTEMSRSPGCIPPASAAEPPATTSTTLCGGSSVSLIPTPTISVIDAGGGGSARRGSGFASISLRDLSRRACRVKEHLCMEATALAIVHIHKVTRKRNDNIRAWDIEKS